MVAPPPMKMKRGMSCQEKNDAQKSECSSEMAIHLLLLVHTLMLHIWPSNQRPTYKALVVAVVGVVPNYPFTGNYHAGIKPKYNYRT